MSHSCLHGIDVLAGDDPAPPSGQFLVIRPLNMPDVIKSQGGALGQLAFSAAPQTVLNAAFDKMRSDMESKLREAGVIADVSVASSVATGPRPHGELVWGIGLGAGLVGAGWATWRYALSPLLRGRK